MAPTSTADAAPPPRRHRVLWVTENHPPSRGGMAQSSDRIVRGLRDGGVEVDVVHLRRGPAAPGAARRPPRPTRRAGGHDLDVVLSPDPEHALHEAWVAVRAHAAASPPSHVVAFGGTHPLLAAPVWSAWLERPLVTLLRGNDLHTGVFSLRRRPVVVDALTRAAAVCVVSTDDAHLVGSLVPTAAVHVVANGIDADGWVPLPSELDAATAWRADHVAPDRRVLGVVGQLKAKKGVTLLLEALARSSVTDRFHVLLVGDCDEDVATWLDGHPALAGTRLPFLDRYELLSRLPACDVVALPSSYDGMPNVALEAMALGRPLLCSTTGGLADLVDAGEAAGRAVGWTFAPGDEPGCRVALHALADAADEELTRRGEAGRELVRSRFTVEAERDGYLAVLDATAGTPGTADARP